VIKQEYSAVKSAGGQQEHREGQRRRPYLQEQQVRRQEYTAVESHVESSDKSVVGSADTSANISVVG